MNRDLRTNCKLCGAPTTILNPDWARGALKASKLSLRAVARLMGISPAYLHDMLNGKKRFTDEQEDRFLVALRGGR